MASGTAITMVDTDNVLKFFGEKLNGIIESFKENEIWLNEIQEEAMMMFVSGFNAEPELMPKTPSERKRRRRCPTMFQDPNKRFSRSRRSLRCSSVKRIKLRNRVFEEDDKCTKMVEQIEPAGLTRSASCAAKAVSRETEKAIMFPVDPINSRVALVDVSPSGCRSVEVHEKAQEAYMEQSVQISQFVNLPQKTGNNSIEKTKENLTDECVEATSFALEPKQPEEKLPAALASEEDCRNSQNPTKIAISCSENMTVGAVKPQACKTSRIQRKDNINSDELNAAKRTDGCENSCKHGVESVPSDPGVLSSEDLLLKGTASPPVSASKVVESKHTKFFHGVQNNQLFKTPVSIGRSMVKSLILRKTPMKVDAKEVILMANHKQQDQEGKRIQKPEEEKKHKLGEFKKKQELRLKHVLEAHSRVEQQEGKKKKKIEQKHLPADNKKLCKKKFSEERSKKLTLKKAEGESQKCQEEERKWRLLQMEEQQQELRCKEEGELQGQCKPAEAKKLERTELKREQHDLHWIAGKKCEGKQQDKFLVEKEQGRLAKKGSLQLQKKQEQTTWKEVQPVKEKLSKGVQEKVTSQEEQQMGELESWSLKSEKTQRTQLEHHQQAEDSKLESWVINLKKKPDREATEVVSNNNVLNKTMEVHHPADLVSYSMTPGSYSKVKLPKINLQNYGMDLNSDDSTDDEEMPRKPIPSWADGKELQQALLEQYYHPLNLDELFSVIKPPNLEAIFGKRKPRYLKRTSSAVWHSPPGSNSFQNISRGFVKH